MQNERAVQVSHSRGINIKEILKEYTVSSHTLFSSIYPAFESSKSVQHGSGAVATHHQEVTKMNRQYNISFKTTYSYVEINWYKTIA